jgi:hypothetical protein
MGLHAMGLHSMGFIPWASCHGASLHEASRHVRLKHADCSSDAHFIAPKNQPRWTNKSSSAVAFSRMG